MLPLGLAPPGQQQAPQHQQQQQHSSRQQQPGHRPLEPVVDAAELALMEAVVGALPGSGAIPVRHSTGGKQLCRVDHNGDAMHFYKQCSSGRFQRDRQ